eukprot:m.154113 g.154113  ORF g.154113 m.154113 type:complete len:69 (-) comp16381_c0_seq1:2694-2900(-)
MRRDAPDVADSKRGREEEDMSEAADEKLRTSGGRWNPPSAAFPVCNTTCNETLEDCLDISLGELEAEL